MTALKVRAPICPYCGQTAVLRDSKYVYHKEYGHKVWVCSDYPLCNSYVGTYRNSKDHAPMGRMANIELRKLKGECYRRFDSLWASVGSDPDRARARAYALLQQVMLMTSSEAQFGKFGPEECRRFIHHFDQGDFA